MPEHGTDRIDTVVVDYGGVLTNPLSETFQAFVEAVGIDPGAIAAAMLGATRRFGLTPMAALEVGAITEQELVERLLAELPPGLGTALEGRPFGELWFKGRRPNEPFLDYLRELRQEGYRLAILTNNVREWEERWRAQVPVAELFELVVNSAHEGVRKPEPGIYRILFKRLGAEPGKCVFIDDDEENCAAARELGMPAFRFVDSDTTIQEVRKFLARSGLRSGGVVG